MTADPSCPACDTCFSDGRDLRVHLMVEHRKSELASLLVDDVDRPQEELLSA